jgi:hypothetical protein
MRPAAPLSLALPQLLLLILLALSPACDAAGAHVRRRPAREGVSPPQSHPGGTPGHSPPGTRNAGSGGTSPAQIATEPSGGTSPEQVVTQPDEGVSVRGLGRVTLNICGLWGSFFLFCFFVFFGGGEEGLWKDDSLNQSERGGRNRVQRE